MSDKKNDNEPKDMVPSEKNDKESKELIPLEKNDDEQKELIKRDTGNVFDRVFRENSLDMMAWIERKFEYRIKVFVPLKEKFAKTLEREIDFLCKITTETGQELLLHLEFQSANNKEMIYRMQEYHALISRKYKLPVRQVVIYLGTAKSKMITKLPMEGVFTGFDLISINEIDSEEFLSDQAPGVIIMALLSNYKKEHIEEILRSILDKLKKVVKKEDTLKRYVNQLLILSRLRKLEPTITKILEDMPITYEIDIEKDYLYQRGLEKGKEALKEEIEKKEEAFREEIIKKEEEIVKKEEEIHKKSIIGFFEVGNDIKTIAKVLKISQKRVKEVIEEWNQKES